MAIGSFLLVSAAALREQPPFFFCAGMIAAFLLCGLTMTIESSVRRRDIETLNRMSQAFTYRRFHNELICSPHHLGFPSNDVHELDDHEFHAD